MSAGGLNETRRGRRVAFAALLLTAVCATPPRLAGANPCLDDVVSFAPGVNGGFQADLLPGIVLGPPAGGGLNTGSLDVVSLGNGGSIVVAFEDNEIVDGPGPDFIVFENAFLTAGPAGQIFTEVGIVEASADGVHFIPFPYNATTLAGLAGKTPVYSNPTNGIDPRDLAQAGGDAFDLATIGLATARYVRVTDPGAAIPDYGNNFPTPGPGKSGFDLDAAVAVNSRDLCGACCDVDGDGQIRPNDVLLLLRAAGGQALAVDACGTPACDTLHCTDANGGGTIEVADATLCIRLASLLDANVQCPTGGGACDLP